jgi:hypothetical protein
MISLNRGNENPIDELIESIDVNRMKGMILIDDSNCMIVIV